MDLESVDTSDFEVSDRFDTVDTADFDTVEDERLTSTMKSVVGNDPDKYASELDLSDASGLSLSTVRSDPTRIKNSVTRGALNLEGLRERSPATAGFMSDYGNASVAHDDLSAMEAIENLLHFSEGLGESIGLGFDIKGKGIQLGVADSGADRMSELINPGHLPPGLQGHAMELSYRMADQMGITSDEEVKAAKTKTVDRLLAETRDLMEQRKALTPDDLNLLEQGIRGGIESIAVNSPGVVAMLATRGRAAPLMILGAQTYAGAYGESRAEGLSPTQAGWFSAIETAVEVGTELLPMKTLETILTGKSTGMTKDALKFLVQEMTTEQIATAGQSLNSYVFGIDEEMNAAVERGASVSEIAGIQMRRQAVTAIATVVAGGSQAVAVTGLRKGIEYTSADAKEQRQQSEVEQLKLDALDSKASESSLRERRIASFKQFIKTADGDKETSVYIDGDYALEYVESLDLATIEADAALAALAVEARDAAVQGSTVQIAIEDFMGDFAGTEHYPELRDGMTLSPETVSPHRQDQYQKDMESQVDALVEIAEQNEQAHEESQQIYEEVVDQLVATNQVNSSNASKMAQFVPAWATARAIRTGKTVREVYSDSGFNVAFAEQAEADDQPTFNKTQDFGDLQLTEDVQVEGTDEVVTMKQSAQRKFDQTMKRRDVVVKLKDCLNA